MPSTDPALSTKGAKVTKSVRNPTLTLHILEVVLTQYLFPKCTWDNVEECVGWCHEVMVDPALLGRIGREWKKRSAAVRTLLEALFVRSDPERFCCGITRASHAIAILLGEIIERDLDWRAEVSSQNPGAILVDSQDFSVHIWWVNRYVEGAG